ncbi:hypothetical protein QMZ65_19415 [Pantoea sp. EABMAA-21]|uniref:hypothetical protein n=1 Tax=unclassified Pantoea TaxID=2630326 RepID=UPI000BDAED54|nr:MULTISPECIES: hypothetical protein [unclassified Pantoea]MDI9279386.1 hypothetical protein [Pantoea sp. EABMAA-21]MXP54074.1 hypothetical protein [Pantoea sp. Seng]SNY66432.1 hypothetical protein SAMN02744778_02238 [Pantoea sp. GL120224-02]
MLYSEDMTGHAIIGEAAVNLAVREEEISVDALLTELNIMLKAEKTSSRSRRISDAISWLRDFRTVGSRGGAGKKWMLSDADSHSAGGESTIRLQADDEDEMR